MSNYENKEPEVLAALYRSKAFVKIKQNLAIGKILFSFVNMEKKTEHIDCYMTAEEFGALLMADVKTGRLAKLLAEGKAKNEQYPSAVWTSPIGGSDNNGSPISRYFEITPGMKTDCALKAVMYPAEKSDTGAFIKKKDSKPLATLIVPCSMNDLRILQYKWSFLEQDYMTKKYSVENTTALYKPNQIPEETPSQPVNNSYEETVPQATPEAKQEMKQEKQDVTPTPVSARFKTKNNIKELTKGGKYLYVCRKEDTEPIALVFLDEKISQTDKATWDKFVKQTQESINVSFTAEYIERDGKFYFSKFAS